jgi:hypothetical protein
LFGVGLVVKKYWQIKLGPSPITKSAGRFYRYCHWALYFTKRNHIERSQSGVNAVMVG